MTDKFLSRTGEWLIFTGQDIVPSSILGWKARSHAAGQIDPPNANYGLVNAQYSILQ